MNRKIIAILALLFLQSSFFARADDAMVDEEMTEIEKTALMVVAKRIDGYNNHDVTAYLAAHDEDVEIFEYPNKAIGNGRSHLEKIFGPQLEQGKGKVVVANQTAIGNTVVSEEYVGFGGPALQHMVAIYTVENNLIKTVRLIESD